MGMPLGNDDNFTAFAFGSVSCVCLVMYLPLLWTYLMDTVAWLWSMIFGRSKHADVEIAHRAPNPFVQLFKHFIIVPKAIFFIFTNPNKLTYGGKLLRVNTSVFFKVAMPKFFNFFYQPRLIFLALWLILLSSVMYSTLTFDGYKVLGLPPTATEREVKKMYRKLSKELHPDQNPAEEARLQYVQVRRAYKSIVAPEEFEKEMGQDEEIGAGIALPKWMMGQGENDGMLLVVMFGFLLAIPGGFYLMLKPQTNESKISNAFATVQALHNDLLALYMEAGIPEDPRSVRAREDLDETVRVLQSCNINVSSRDDLANIPNFPVLAEFRKRCLEPVRFKKGLLDLNFDEKSIERLTAYFKEHPEPERPDKPEPVEPYRVAKHEFDVILYFIEQVLIKMEDPLADIKDLCDQANENELRSSIRMRNHHAKIRDGLVRAYNSEKSFRGEMLGLMDNVRNAETLFEELIRDYDGLMRRMEKRWKSYYEQQLKQQQQQMRRGASPR